SSCTRAGGNVPSWVGTEDFFTRFRTPPQSSTPYLPSVPAETPTPDTRPTSPYGRNISQLLTIFMRRWLPVVLDIPSPCGFRILYALINGRNPHENDVVCCTAACHLKACHTRRDSVVWAFRRHARGELVADGSGTTSLHPLPDHQRHPPPFLQ